jgi:hypothetical protein
VRQLVGALDEYQSGDKSPHSKEAPFIRRILDLQAIQPVPERRAWTANN